MRAWVVQPCNSESCRRNFLRGLRPSTPQTITKHIKDRGRGAENQTRKCRSHLVACSTCAVAQCSDMRGRSGLGNNTSVTTQTHNTQYSHRSPLHFINFKVHACSTHAQNGAHPQGTQRVASRMTSSVRMTTLISVAGATAAVVGSICVIDHTQVWSSVGL